MVGNSDFLSYATFYRNAIHKYACSVTFQLKANIKIIYGYSWYELNCNLLKIKLLCFRIKKILFYTVLFKCFAKFGFLTYLSRK